MIDIGLDTDDHRNEHRLISAADMNDLRLLKQSISEGANVNFRTQKTGMTALHIALALKNFEISTHLLSTGKCDLSLPDNNGWTALDYLNKTPKMPVLDYNNPEI